MAFLRYEFPDLHSYWEEITQEALDAPCTSGWKAGTVLAAHPCRT